MLAPSWGRSTLSGSRSPRLTRGNGANRREHRRHFASPRRVASFHPTARPNSGRLQHLSPPVVVPRSIARTRPRRPMPCRHRSPRRPLRDPLMTCPRCRGAMLFVCEGHYPANQEFEVTALLRLQALTPGSDAQCVAEVVDRRIVVSASYREHPARDQVESGVEAHCVVPPLEPGTWTLVYDGSNRRSSSARRRSGRQCRVDGSVPNSLRGIIEDRRSPRSSAARRHRSPRCGRSRAVRTRCCPNSRPAGPRAPRKCAPHRRRC
jgi:hypothetical protein